MRRGLAGLLFFVAAILLAIAAGGWWMQRIAFSPSSSNAVTRAVMEDAELRGELATVVAEATTAATGRPADQLRVDIDALAQNPAAAPILADIVADAHARVIGSGGPVQITGAQMVEIVRDQVVAGLPAVTLPVAEVSLLDSIRTVLQWLVPLAALIGLAAAVLGVIAHPERSDAIFGIGVFCILAAVLAFVLGYVVPAFALPALNDNSWLDVIPAIANSELALVGGLACALAVVGVVLVIGSGATRRRKTGWSTSVRAPRYSGEQRRWS